MSGGPIQTEEDTPIAFKASGGDRLGGAVTITVDQPTHGVLLGVPPDVTYVPAPDFFGDDYIRVVVSDGVHQAETLRRIIVTPVNDPPAMGSHETSVSAHAPLDFDVAELLAGDSDADGDSLTLVSVGNAVHGTVTLSDGKIRFVPEPNYFGEASFEYVTSDGTTQSTGRVTIMISGTNEAPVATDDVAEAAEDTPVSISVTTLLANDHDSESTPTVTAVGSPTHGLVSLDGGIVTFSPAADFHGEASFQYTISDGALSASATVTVVVASVNDAPVATGDSAATDEDIPAVLAAADLLANDSDLDGTLTVTGVGSATHGSVGLAAGLVTFVPAENYSGAASFEYTVSDGELERTAIVNVTIAPVNDAPIAVADSGSGTEDTQVVISAATLLDNDSDVDSTPSVVGVSNPSVGVVSLDGTTITYTPAPGYSGAATFEYVISDGTLSSMATVSLTIAAVDDAPVAVADSASGTEDTALVISVATLLDNDSDVDSTMTVTSVGSASHGSVSLSGTTITFVPAEDFNGAASFQYTLTADGQTASATVSLTIAAVNDAPVAVGDSASGDEDQNVVLSTATLLDNDSDVDSTPTITAVGNPTHGSVSLDGTTITFTPAAGYNGSASFEYTLSDGDLSDTATVSLSIGAVDDAPVATGDSASGTEDTDVVLAAATLLDNDSDSDSTMTITSVGSATHGSVALSGTTITFTPAANYNGAASFQYTLTADGQTASATVSLTIAAVNDAPVAVGDSASGDEDQDLVLSAATLLDNDSDIDSTPTITAVGDATHGAVSLSGTTITFTPAAGYNGSASFAYTLSDGDLSDTATVSLSIDAVDDAPVANDDSASGTEDQDVVLTAATLLENDSDSDSTMTITSVGSATHGSVALSGTTITFTPAANYSGAASFQYTLTADGRTVSATVSLSLAAVDDAPVAEDDPVDGSEDTPVVLDAATLLANDSDIDSTMTVTTVENPLNGTVSMDGTTITYTPDANFSGEGGFRYTITAGGQTASAKVSITVEAVDDAPVADDDSASGTEDQNVVIDAATLLGNDSDIDSTMTVTAVDNPLNGSVSMDGSTITYTPDADFYGEGGFRYTVSAGGQTTTAKVWITVDGVNDAPVAENDTASGSEDQEVVIPVGALLINDSDVDGEPSVVSVGDASNGVATLGEGMVTFMPDEEFSGEASFQYTISDGALEATATVTVTIAAVNDAPVAGDQSVTSVEGAPVAITLGATDVDGPTAEFLVTVPPEHGQLLGDPPSLSYVPTPGYSGADSFEFTVSDGDNQDGGTISITVTAVSEPVNLCGNDELDDGEICDDGNNDAGDGCRADCQGLEECGDGLVDSLAGETCDDGNTDLEDGCDDLCQLDPFQTVPPTQISVAEGCTTLNSNTGRKITSDELGNFYVVMSCGGQGYVVTSTDRGATFTAPAPLGINGVSEIAVEGGPAGTAYVSAVADGDLVFTMTTDSGATWSAASTLEAGIFDSEISMDTFESSVYVLASSGSELHLWSNHAGGVGSFELTALAQANVFHDVIVDGISGTVFACSDTPQFHIRKSTDGGANFGGEMNPGGQAFFSDWAGSNGFIYVVGTSGDTNIEVIPVGDPGSSTPVEGLPSTMTSSARAIDADAVGNAYVASQMDDGSIQIDRMFFNAESILSEDARNVDASGTMPGIAALPTNDGALYVFTKNGTEIWVGVTVY